jgi:hypothetical protein
MVTGPLTQIATHKLVRGCTVVVPAGAVVELYRQALGDYVDDVVGLPPEASGGAAAARNWVLDAYDERVIVLLPDDLTALWCNTREEGYGIYDHRVIRQVLESSAACAQDLGAALFGFNAVAGSKKYQDNKPWAMVGFVSGVVGIVGREVRYDQNFAGAFPAEADLCLSNLYAKRVLWKDERFTFCRRFETAPPADMEAAHAARAVELQELDYLSGKWGRYVKVKPGKQGKPDAIEVKVKRTRAL